MFQSRLVFLPDDAVSDGLALVRDNGYLVFFGPGGPVHRCAEDDLAQMRLAQGVLSGLATALARAFGVSRTTSEPESRRRLGGLPQEARAAGRAQADRRGLGAGAADARRRIFTKCGGEGSGRFGCGDKLCGAALLRGEDAGFTAALGGRRTVLRCRQEDRGTGAGRRGSAGPGGGGGPRCRRASASAPARRAAFQRRSTVGFGEAFSVCTA